MITFTTTNGKEVQVVKDIKTTHFKIQFGSGGEIPVGLSGLFTNEYNAKLAIMVYLDKDRSKKDK